MYVKKYIAPIRKILIKTIKEYVRVNNTAVVEAIIIEDAELINRICKTDLVKYIEY